MSVAIGTRLGPYEIVAAIGAGGMGEVYKARDTKLDRNVAIKVLPDLFADDPERLARFEREARVLAALNHPHIAQIYGVVEQPPALVIEFAEGEDLARRLARGPLPVDQALAIARQIADALQTAHDQGIVHRDLKPANIKVRPDGAVKVLDFGLAKAMDAGLDRSRQEPLEAPGATTQSPARLNTLANSPTFVSPAVTQLGVILGTAAYMAPEQARGRTADKRADIWAFGCVLYEMLTGRPAFDGEDTTAVLAKIIEREPDMTLLPAATPPSVRRLLRRCLEKKTARRLADMHDAGLELDDALAGDAEAAAVETPRPSRALTPWAASTAVGLALSAALFIMWWRASAPRLPPPMRYDIQATPNNTLALAPRPAVAVSRDGSMVVFVASAEGATRLYLRRRSDADAQALGGTEGASNPVFSLDGRWLTFVAGRDLKKMMIGAAPARVASVEDFRGMTWLDDRTLVYAPDASGGLLRVSADGGPPATLTTIDGAKGERTHRWPAALPGGKAVLFVVGINASPDDYNNAEVDAVVVATGERRRVLSGASFVTYIPTGHLVFARNGSLYAVRFDPDRLVTLGVPALVVEGVAGDVTTGAMSFACADDGTLVYVAGSIATNGNLRRLVWSGRSAGAGLLDLPAGSYTDQRISPDGTRFAIIVGASGTGDVWIYDLRRGTFTRFTFDGRAATPVWSADGRTLFYASIAPSGQTAKTAIFSKRADGSRDAVPVATVDGRAFLGYLTPDGKSAGIVLTSTLNTVGDIVAIPIADGGASQPIVMSPADEHAPDLSRDGRWLAYQSDENGRFEVYVRDLSGTGARWQVSTAGGEEPRWSSDGTELYYRIDDRMMRVAVRVRPEFESGKPEVLFDGVYNLRSDTGISYDVDPKTGRFLMVRPADPAAAATTSTVKVVLNWFDDVRRAMANAK